MVTYYATLQPDRKRGYVVRFPDLPNATTQGESLEDAREMAVDALRTLFLGQIAHSEPVPPPGKERRGKKFHAISLPALDSAKVELYRAFRSSGMRKARLAAGMRIPRAHVDRLFNLNHASRLDQIEAAFRVLGKTLVLDVKSAA
jgi:antitoxin HicB